MITMRSIVGCHLGYRSVAHFFPGLEAALIFVLPFVTPEGKVLGAVDVVDLFAGGFGTCAFGACVFGAAAAGFFAAPPTLLLTPVPVPVAADFFAPPTSDFPPRIAGLPAVVVGGAVLFVG